MGNDSGLIGAIKIISSMITIAEFIARIAGWGQLSYLQGPFRGFLFLILVSASVIMFFFVIHKSVRLLHQAIKEESLYLLLVYVVGVMVGAFLALMLIIDWQLVIAGIDSQVGLFSYIITCIFTVPAAVAVTYAINDDVHVHG